MLQLVQSCVSLPTEHFETALFADEKTSSKDKRVNEDAIRQMIEEFSSCTLVFCDRFLERCKTAESVDGDNRQIVSHFVNDLINVLDAPEWPAADLVLQVLSKRICEKLIFGIILQLLTRKKYRKRRTRKV